jgi:hypothetical protein
MYLYADTGQVPTLAVYVTLKHKRRQVPTLRVYATLKHKRRPTYSKLSVSYPTCTLEFFIINNKVSAQISVQVKSKSRVFFFYFIFLTRSCCAESVFRYAWSFCVRLRLDRDFTRIIVSKFKSEDEYSNFGKKLYLCLHICVPFFMCLFSIELKYFLLI